MPETTLSSSAQILPSPVDKGAPDMLAAWDPLQALRGLQRKLVRTSTAVSAPQTYKKGHTLTEVCTQSWGRTTFSRSSRDTGQVQALARGRCHSVAPSHPHRIHRKQVEANGIPTIPRAVKTSLKHSAPFHSHFTTQHASCDKFQTSALPRVFGFCWTLG